MAQYCLENKTLVYWGVGLVCKTCLEYRKDFSPAFLIDQNPKGQINGLEVKSPEQIDDWKNLFIVITTIYVGEVEKHLSSLGLVKDRDFAFYKDFFDIKSDITSSLEAMNTYILQHKADKGGILLYTPCFNCRQKEIMTNFFFKYRAAHKAEPFIVISSIDAIPEECATEKIGAKVFNLADIVRWDGSKARYSMCLSSANAQIVLTDKEYQDVAEIEDIKNTFDKEKSLHISEQLYFYLKNIVDIISPKKFIIWGGETRMGLMLDRIANDRHIQHGFMEHGWLSGTYQFDRRGIGGMSEYAENPSVLMDKPIKNPLLDVEKIKEYVINSGIDSGTTLFKSNVEDERQLKKLLPTKKTVFLVGYGDVKINVNTAFWNRYYSGVVKSNEEAFYLVKTACLNKGYNFIYKPHPSSRSLSEDEKFRNDKDVIYITDMSIDSLIKMADVVVSTRSAVDYKVLVYSKPLVSLGRTTLQNQQMIYEVQNASEVQSKIENAMRYGMTKEQKERFNLHLHKLLENHLWDELSHEEFKYGLSLENDFFMMGGGTTV